MPRLHIRSSALLLLSFTLLTACGSGAVTSTESTPGATVSTTVSDSYSAVLMKYNWMPQGNPEIRTVTLPLAQELPTTMAPPWMLYLEASRAIGLDFTPWAGQTLPLRVYQLGRDPKLNLRIRGYLLVADQRVVGAWLDFEGAIPGLYPLNTKPEALGP